jgi:hypothetical protein
LLPAAAPAAPFEVRDDEGFGESLTALTIDLPDGFTGQGRIAWVKPCSGSDMFEILFTATTPDGQRGMRTQPSHQFVWNGADVTGVDPTVAQLTLQQIAQGLADMQAQFAGSNCHVGTIAGTEDLIARLILPRRPAGARVLQVTADEPRLAAFRQSLGAQVPGMLTDFDAVIVDLTYPGVTGPLRERLWLAWYRFRDDPATGRIAGLPALQYQTTTVEAPRFIWAPEATATADFAALERAMASTRADPVWQGRVNAERQRRAEERRRTQADRDRARAEDAARRDADHARFLQTIRE